MGALSAPVHDRHEHQGAEDKDTGGGGSGSGGGGGLRVRDLLGGPQSDTPYPGDMADEPVQLEGGEQVRRGGGAGGEGREGKGGVRLLCATEGDMQHTYTHVKKGRHNVSPRASRRTACSVLRVLPPLVLSTPPQDASSQSTPPEPQPGRDIVSEGARGGDPVPHVAQSAARRRDPAVVAPLEGGAASTVRDSGEVCVCVCVCVVCRYQPKLNQTQCNKGGGEGREGEAGTGVWAVGVRDVWRGGAVCVCVWGGGGAELVGGERGFVPGWCGGSY